VALLLVLLVSGYKAGTQERTISLARKTTLPVHTNDKYKDFYGGYHDGAVAADNDDSRQRVFIVVLPPVIANNTKPTSTYKIKATST
jgi:hypothetical protein